MNPNAQWQVEVVSRNYADIPEGATMLIPTPTIVEGYIKDIPEGIHTSLQQMRKDLAAQYNAEYTCPITSGIFLRIVSEKAYEEYQEGESKDDIAPFWRMINKKTPTAKKLSFGTDFIIEQRQLEGLPE